MKPILRREFLLNIALAALAVLIIVQLYGILWQDAPSRPIVQGSITDTSHIPIQINILNGCGVSGVGNTLTKYCRQFGYDVVEMGNYKSFDVKFSIVIDRSGKSEEAYRLASLLGIDKKNVIKQFSTDQMVTASVVIGKDYQTLNPWK